MTTEVRTQFEALLKEFGDAWMAGDAGRISKVFAEDGVFVADPFADPTQGRSDIEAYWKDLPFAQAEVKFRFGEVHVVGPWFAAEFKCTFRRRRTGEPVDVRGAIFCETEGGAISEMRMYYHRVVRDR